MGIVGYDRKQDQAPECFGCNGTPAAFWSGPKIEIGVCARCAAEILPRLLADSLAHPQPERPALYQSFADGIKNFIGSYWDAACQVFERVNCKRLERVREGKTP
jgi:hypothetical protein